MGSFRRVTRRTSSRLLVVGVVVVAAAACSGDDDATSVDTEAVPVSGADTTEPAGSAPTAATAPPTTLSPAATTASEPTTAAPVTASTLVPSTEPSTETTSDVAPTSSTPETASPVGPDGYPPQPAGVPYPSRKWPSGPLPKGVDEQALDAAVETAFGAPDAETRVASVAVIDGGKLVYERYHPLDGPKEVFPSWSMAKSFASALIGLLVTDGRLELDEHPERPEWRKKGDPRRAITLRQLLQMSSGLRWDEGPDYGPWAGAPDSAHFVAARPLDSKPGTTFEYSTGTTSLIAGIAADELGGCKQMDDYLHARLLDPIGITSEQIFQDARGCWYGGFGMNMTTRDFARFGLLYLRGGEWNGEQILPTSWIDETRVPATTNPVYGLQFWLNEADQTFEANGAFGQRIVIQPEHDLVIAVNNFGGDDCAVVAAVLEQFTGEPAGGCIGATGN
jgi:CubicO group peptidase (beta-lactamase class C family)